jgi:ribosome-associated toxin RatA of RatAB toxin-antitoxin module
MTSIADTVRPSLTQTLLAGALMASAAMAFAPAAASAESDEAAEARAENAGIFTAQLPVDGSSIASGKAVIVVDRPIEEVLRIVLDYGNYVDFMPNFTRSKVLAQRGSRAMVYMEVSVGRGMYTLYGQLNLAEQPRDGGVRVVKGRLIDGNIDAFDATFTLRPVDGGTEISFDIYVDPDLPLPSSVFSRENERAAGRAVRALRDRVARAAGPTA